MTIVIKMATGQVYVKPAEKAVTHKPADYLLVFLKLASLLDERPAFTVKELSGRLPMLKKSYFNVLSTLTKEGILVRSQRPDGLFQYKLGPAAPTVRAVAIKDVIMRHNPDLFGSNNRLSITTGWAGERRTETVEAGKETMVTLRSLKPIVRPGDRRGGTIQL
jgi:hypothetical protein